MNDTRVVPARLLGQRADTGGKVELLVLGTALLGDTLPGRVSPPGLSPLYYRCLGQPGRRLKPGTKLLFDHGSLQAEVVSREGGERLVRFSESVRPSTSSRRTESKASERTAGIEELLLGLGQVPLPPYIDRPVVPEDARWYQTVFARHPGAVAAPTAGLHFTEGLLDRIRQRGVQVLFLTLHVGWGTFKPVAEKELAEGRLHPEEFHVPPETLEAIRAAKARGGRVVAVGTTVVRALEACFLQNEIASPASGGLAMTKWSSTELFIRPGFPFQVVDAMITNFHLPRTSLLYLVAAFAGEDKVLAAYQEAIRQRYRFYSYGDAMLIA